MSTTDSRVEALAKELETVNQQLMAACAACNEAEWGAAVWDDGRTVSVVFNHIADAYKAVSEWGAQIAAGEIPPQLTMEQIHQFNDRSASEAAGRTKGETMARLKENGARAATLLRSLEDDQLDICATVPFMGGETSAERLINTACIGHARAHLEEILSTR